MIFLNFEFLCVINVSEIYLLLSNVIPFNISELVQFNQGFAGTQCMNTQSNSVDGIDIVKHN